MWTLEEYLEEYYRILKEKENELAGILAQQFSKDSFFRKRAETEHYKSIKEKAEKEYDDVRNAEVDMYLSYHQDAKKTFKLEGNELIPVTIDPIDIARRIRIKAKDVEETAKTELVNGYKPTSIMIERFPLDLLEHKERRK